MTGRNRMLLINTALTLHKERLEKKLSKEKEKFDKLCSKKLPARTGVRGGQNTKIMASISTSADTMRKLKEMIEELEKEIRWNKMTREEFENLGVGETFQIGCRKFTVVETDKEERCKKCDCYDFDYYCLNLENDGFIPLCSPKDRKDKKAVIFEEVEE